MFCQNGGFNMAIKKIKIKGFKIFKDIFEIEFNNKINVIVGNNEAGKSTILEAINLALTGLYCGKSIKAEVSQYLFNNEMVAEYINSVNNGSPLDPPSIRIEIYFDGNIDAQFEGNFNTDKASSEGIVFEIAFADKYRDEYEALIKEHSMLSLPIEYYETTWTSFSRQTITTRNIPIKSAMIDSSSYRYQNGSDVYISKIVKDLLEPEEITSISQAHRKMKESFINDDSIKAINERISADSSIIDGDISLTVNLGTKNAWENSLTTQLNDIPFGYIGKGAQCIVKTELALKQKKSLKAQVILIEEPECHLSFSNLNKLIHSLQEKYNNKQLIITTHSSFVANKLGLNNITLLKGDRRIKLCELDSVDFFKKIPGYDTLRFILCKKAILVEGASDELVVQKAYMDQNNGKLPIHDQIDVISVGLAFLRFLEIADKLNINVCVVTDNDGNVEALEKKYIDYINNKKDNIKICYDNVVDEGDLVIGNKPYNYNTLEPKLLKANSDNISLFNSILGTNCEELDELCKYMKNNKTEVALAIFNTKEKIEFPQYIMEAIKNE